MSFLFSKVTQLCSCGAKPQVQIWYTNSLPFSINQGPTSWGSKNVLVRKTYQFFIPRPNCNVCVDGETGFTHIPLSSFRDISRVSKNSSQFWGYLAKDSVRFHFSCHLCFWPTSYKSEVPVTPSFGSINLPEWFTELRKPFVYSITSYYKRI